MTLYQLILQTKNRLENPGADDPWVFHVINVDSQKVEEEFSAADHSGPQLYPTVPEGAANTESLYTLTKLGGVNLQI